MARTKNRNNNRKPNNAQAVDVDPRDIVENKPTPAEVYNDHVSQLAKKHPKMPHFAVEGRDYTTVITVEVQEVTIPEIREKIFGIDVLSDEYLQTNVIDVINQRLLDMGYPIYKGFYQNTQDAIVNAVYSDVVDSVLGERITYAILVKVDEDLRREMAIEEIVLPDEIYRIDLLEVADYVKAEDLEICGESYQNRIAQAIKTLKAKQERFMEINKGKNTNSTVTSSQVEVETNKVTAEPTVVKAEVEIKADDTKHIVAHTASGDVEAESVSIVSEPTVPQLKPVLTKRRNSDGTVTMVAKRGADDVSAPREFILKVMRQLYSFQEYHATFIDSVTFDDAYLVSGITNHVDEEDVNKAIGVKTGDSWGLDLLNPVNIVGSIVKDRFIKIINPTYEEHSVDWAAHA